MPARKGTLHFKNKGAYQRWNAYRFLHVEGKESHHHANRPVEIAGHPHKVHHCDNCGEMTHSHSHGGLHCCGRMGCCHALKWVQPSMEPLHGSMFGEKMPKSWGF